MPNRIIPKKSSVAAKVPLATDLSVGEIAINLVDKKIYSKDSGGTVIELANGTVTSVSGTGTVSGLTLSGSVTTSGNLTLGGTLTLTSGQVTTALGFTPYNSTNPNGYITSSGTAANVSGTVAVANGGTGSTTAAGARTNLGSTTVGSNLFTLANPSAITFPRVNADNTVSMLDAATFRSAIGAGTSSTTGTVTSVSGTGTASGLTLSGTVTSSGSLTLSGTLSASIDNITDEHRLFNNMGDNHGTRTSFDAQGAAATVNFGWRYVQGNTNAPNVGNTGSNQYYSLYVGLGNDYAYNQYGMQVAIPRTSTTPYLSLRFQEGGAFGAWQKISAGYADSAGNADTLDGNHAAAFALVGQTTYIGTTAVALNRASAALALTGITSIDGSAATLTTGRTIGMTGDVTWTSASFNGSANVTGTATLANSGVTAGTYNNSATAVTPITFDAKGRATATGTAVTITPAWGSITSKPTTLSGYGITDALALSGGSLTGGLKEAKVAMAANDVNLNSGNYFTKTISGATTLTVSNVPATGTVAAFVLDLTNGGSGTITWWSGMKWVAGTAPTLTTSGRDVLAFFTHDGGTTWSGFVLGKDVK